LEEQTNSENTQVKSSGEESIRNVEEPSTFTESKPSSASFNEREMELPATKKTMKKGPQSILTSMIKTKDDVVPSPRSAKYTAENEATIVTAPLVRGASLRRKPMKEINEAEVEEDEPRVRVKSSLANPIPIDEPPIQDCGVQILIE
jgi:hypothetical protein